MKTKRIFSFILTFIMLLSVVLPINVYADELIDEGSEEFSQETMQENPAAEENQDQSLIDEEIIDEQSSDKQDDEIFDEEDISAPEEENPAAEEKSGDNKPVNEDLALEESETFNAGTLKVEVSPMEIEATASENVIFKATVTGASGAVSYQWQYSQDNGKTWKNSGLSGSKTAKLKVQATDARLSVLYRCKVTCGNQVAVSEGAHFVRPDSPFVWSTNADGTLTLVQYRANEATVVVPETYNGKTVTVIGESAFEGKDLTSVDLPDTIIVIGKRAFADCKNLSEMK